MSTIKLASTLTNPEHVSGTVVPTTSGGIFASESLLVWQEQAFMGGKEVSLGKGSGRSVDTNSFHEAEGFVHFGSELSVSDRQRI
jgi:hypothetical protein